MMATRTPLPKLSHHSSMVLFFFFFLFIATKGSDFTIIEEATIDDIQGAFSRNELTSRQLVDFYLQQIESLNPVLRAVLEPNPDARDQADEADRQRRSGRDRGRPLLHGVPVMLKDSIGTKDKMNTTAGSYALVGSKVARDAHVVERLRDSGAVILGKASLSEWYSCRSPVMPDGWCARGGQAINPYVEWGSTCGSSSGSAISVAANMVAVSLGTETDGSIICPADHNSVVGIKPTVGLTSRAGVIPISPRQDTIGPICRTVADAVHVLDVIVGFDPKDYNATQSASKFIPEGGYKQFLKKEGLKGKKLGVVRNPFLKPYDGSSAISIFEHHLNVLRQRGATVVDNLEIENSSIILDPFQSGETIALLTEFKLSINNYLQELVYSPVRSLAEVIEFNLKHPELEKTNEYGQDLFIASEMTSGFGQEEIEAVERMEQLSKSGFEKLMKENQLDALVTLGSDASTVLAIGGYPAITVPAGYDNRGMPFGLCFGGLKGTEPKLIEIAYDFEQATKGAIVVDNLEIANITTILNPFSSGEAVASIAEFKLSLSAYLQNFVVSPVRSLAGVIAFNQNKADLENLNEYGQDIFLFAQATNGIAATKRAALANLATLTREGFEKLMIDHKLDALVTPGWRVARVLAIGEFPGINAPAGYDSKAVPFGITFGGLKGSESKLIQIAYGFEQAPSQN